MNLKQSEIISFRQQLEASKNHLPNRYLLSKLMSILNKLILSKNTDHGFRYNQIYTLLETLDEPYDIRSADLINPKNKDIIIDLYDEIIETLK
ncbi:hypothetical protein PG279_06155 [Riemerella anatipestifer]|nr:hypothetical protein [Riemerella anatipestifer]